MSDLNTRQKKYADNLMKGMSQKEAYMKAGYKATGNAAEVNASKLLRKTKVQDYLQKKRRDRLSAVSSQLTQLTKQAIRTITEIQNKNLSELDGEERKALKLKLDSAKDILNRVGLSGKSDGININIQNQNKVEKKELNIMQRARKVYKEMKENATG